MMGDEGKLRNIAFLLFSNENLKNLFSNELY